MVRAITIKIEIFRKLKMRMFRKNLLKNVAPNAVVKIIEIQEITMAAGFHRGSPISEELKIYIKHCYCYRSIVIILAKIVLYVFTPCTS